MSSKKVRVCGAGPGRHNTLVESFDCDALNFEMSAEQQWSGTDKGSSGQWVLKISRVNGVELVEEGDVAAKHLDEDQVVHGEHGSSEGVAERRHHRVNLSVEIGGHGAGTGSEADVTGKISGVAYDYRPAEGKIAGSACVWNMDAL